MFKKGKTVRVINSRLWSSVQLLKNIREDIDIELSLFLLRAKETMDGFAVVMNILKFCELKNVLTDHC